MAGGIPSICYAKIIGLKRKLDWAIIVFMGIISVLGMVGAIMSVVDAATDTQ